MLHGITVDVLEVPEDLKNSRCEVCGSLAEAHTLLLCEHLWWVQLRALSHQTSLDGRPVCTGLIHVYVLAGILRLLGCVSLLIVSHVGRTSFRALCCTYKATNWVFLLLEEILKAK